MLSLLVFYVVLLDVACVCSVSVCSVIISVCAMHWPVMLVREFIMQSL